MPSTALRHLARTVFIGVLFFLLLAIGTGFTLWKYTVQDHPREIHNTPRIICGNVASDDNRVGKRLFNTNCAACHTLDKKTVGPALRHTDSLLLWTWFRTGKDGTPKELGIKFHQQQWEMSISDAALEQLLDYINPYR